MAVTENILTELMNCICQDTLRAIPSLSFSMYFLVGSNNKQLLDEVEHHDIMNYQNRGLCCLPKPKAEADNLDMRF